MSPTLKERGLRRVRISGVGNSGCNSAFCLSYLAKNDKNPPTSPYWRSRSGVTFLILQRGKIRLWEVRDLAIATELIHRGCRFDPWVGKVPWRRKWQPTLVFLPGESQGQGSLAGCSPWSHSLTWLSNWARVYPIYSEGCVLIKGFASSLKWLWSIG